MIGLELNCQHEAREGKQTISGCEIVFKVGVWVDDKMMALYDNGVALEEFIRLMAW